MTEHSPPAEVPNTPNDGGQPPQLAPPGGTATATTVLDDGDLSARTLTTNEQIASTWRRFAALPYNWRAPSSQAGVLGPPQHGEGGGIYVTCDRVPRRAYMKPRKKEGDPEQARAAREKICADLAHDLAVNVPPVILAERSQCGSDEPFVAVSLVMFPRQMPWSQVKSVIPDLTADGKLVRDALPQAAAAGLVFDTWVDQPDHNDHPHNIIFGFEPTDLARNALLFLDFAFSLGFGGRWANGGYKKMGRVPFPRFLLDFADEKALAESLARLEALPEQTVRDIVTRVPVTHLAAGVRSTMIDGLLYRQSLVRDVIRGYGFEGV